MKDTKTMIEDLYWELNAIYSSEHNDSVDETKHAISALTNAVNAHCVPIDVIRLKMRQLTQRVNEQGAWKSKLSAAIHSRFWNKEFVEMVEYRHLKIE